MMPLVLLDEDHVRGQGQYMDDWKTKFIFPAMGMVPIDRSGGNDGRPRSLSAAAQYSTW